MAKRFAFNAKDVTVLSKPRPMVKVFTTSGSRRSRLYFGLGHLLRANDEMVAAAPPGAEGGGGAAVGSASGSGAAGGAP